MNRKVCEFIDIGLDNYSCVNCGIVIHSEYGIPANICSSIDLSKIPEIDKQMLCSKEELDGRYKICEQCEFLNNGACNKCGCIITKYSIFKNKLLFKNHACPIGKWPDIC
jgi:hypothetical protein